MDGSRQRSILRHPNTIIGRVGQIFHLTNKQTLERTILQLHAAKISLLWIALFDAGTPRGNKRDRIASHAIRRLFDNTVEIGGRVIIDAPQRSLTWELPEIQELVATDRAYVTRQRWCNFHIKDPDTNKPSLAITKVLTSVPIPDQGECACGVPHGQHAERNPQHHRPIMRERFLRALIDMFQGIRPEYFKQPKQPDQFRRPDVEDIDDAKVVSLVTENYPTEQRTRQKQHEKALKEANDGKSLPKRRKPAEVEQHFDDCGSDLTPISLWTTISDEHEDEYDSHFNSLHFITSINDPTTNWNYGFRGRQSILDTASVDDGTCFVHYNIDGIVPSRQSRTLTEIARGENDCVQLLHRSISPKSTIHRHLHTIQMPSAHVAEDIKRHLDQAQPDMVMFTLGPSRHLAEPRVSWLAAMCADHQLSRQRHFLIETYLDNDCLEHFLRRSKAGMSAKHPRIKIHFLMNNDLAANDDSSEFWASDATILQPLQRQRSRPPSDDTARELLEQPIFLALQGPLAIAPNLITWNAGHARRCVAHRPWPGRNSWPTDIRSALAEGIQRAFAILNSFPVDGEANDTSGMPTEAAAAARTKKKKLDPKYTCPACRWHRRKDDPRHTRDPDNCQFPLTEPTSWTCPACVRHAGPGADDHTWDETCELHTRSARLGTAVPPTGRDGRDPRVPAAVGSSMRARGPTADAADQADISDGPLSPTSPADVPGDIATGANDPLPTGGAVGSEELERETARRRSTQRDESNRQRPPGAHHGSSDVPGPPRVYQRQPGREVSTQAETQDGEWLAFDLGRAIQLLHSPDTAIVRRTLRRLHVRFWHASAARLGELLRRAGAPSSAISLLKEIVETCKACRMWARPRPKSLATGMRMATSFNEAVQWDILFYRNLMISHLLDEAIRWTTASILEAKTAAAITSSIMNDWIRPYGPMRLLIADQERGLLSDEASTFFDRHQIQLRSKEPGAHAQMVERHHEILRAMLHRVETQLLEEGILGITMPNIVAECCLCKNLLVSVGGVSPYQALYGRLPPIMAEFEPLSDTQLDDTGPGQPGVAKHHHRLREIAVQAMVDVTAKQRIERANKSRTRITTEALQLEQGDLIDFHRPAISKDDSGWRGPAQVVNVEPGTITVKWQERYLQIRTQDARRSLILFVMYTAQQDYGAWPNTSPMQVLTTYADSLAGRVIRLGWVQHQGWYRAKANEKASHVVSALLHVASCGLQLVGCIGGRLGSGVPVLEGAMEIDESFLWFWRSGYPRPSWYLQTSGTTRVKLTEVFGDSWPKMSFVQFYMVGADDVQALRDLEPDIPNIGGPHDPDIVMPMRVDGNGPGDFPPRPPVQAQPASMMTPPPAPTTSHSPSVMSQTRTSLNSGLPPLPPPYPPPTTPAPQMASVPPTGPLPPHVPSASTPSHTFNGDTGMNELVPIPSSNRQSRSTKRDYEYKAGAWIPKRIRDAKNMRFGPQTPQKRPDETPDITIRARRRTEGPKALKDKSSDATESTTAGSSSSPADVQPTTPSAPLLPIQDQDSDDSDRTQEYDNDEEMPLLVCQGPVELLDQQPGIREAPPVRHFTTRFEEADYRHYVSTGSAHHEQPRDEPLEFSISWPLTRWQSDATTEPDPTHVTTIRIFATGLTEKLIEKEMNLIGRDEALRHAADCRIAMRDELKRWIDLQSFERQPRSRATNLLDARWVLKWKQLKDSATTKAASRAIKARMTVRGYKDQQANDLQTFAATTSRWGQRVILVIAVQNQWKIFGMDVAQAFLRGLPFAELAKLKGEINRVVSFTLPPGSAEILRELPGFHDFDERYEVLKMLRAGFGLKDAPRAWNIVLAAVLAEFQLYPTQSDKQIYLKFENSVLVMAISTHVDDLKGAGTNDQRDKLRRHLENKFGKLAYDEGTFTHVGIVHEQLEDMSISTHQNDYVKTLRTIQLDNYEFCKADEAAPEELASQYMSLLGGAAWMTLTRPACCVYVSYLQRHAKSPTFQHIRDLNRLVRWMQKTPQTLNFKKLNGKLRLIIVSDSSFSAGDTQGLVMRGCFVLLVSSPNADPFGQVLVLDYYARKQSHVCRSTFSAELHAALDAFNHGILLQSVLTEVFMGNQTASNLLELQEAGKLQPPMELCIDAKSVFDAIAATPISVPSDKHLLLHLLKLREHIDRGQLRTLWWIDTLSMLADGMTKGAIRREPILLATGQNIWKLQGLPPIQFPSRTT